MVFQGKAAPLPFLAKGISNAGVMSQQPPADYVAANARAFASVTITVGGTVTDGDIATIDLNHALLPSSKITKNIAIVTADDLVSIAQKIAKAICDDTDLQSYGVYATSIGAVVTVYWPGLVGNSLTLTKSLSEGATATITLGNSGVAASGSGPVVFHKDLQYSYKGQTLFYQAGQAIKLGADLVTALVAAKAPIM